MMTPRAERGGALLLTLIMALALAAVAAALARISMSRSLVFSDGRDRDYGASAADSGANEIRSCIAAAGGAPPTAGATPCVGGAWSPWAASQGGLSTTKTFSLGARRYSVTVRHEAATQDLAVTAAESL